ncbi:hypothetical protein Droror1_Dr00001257 [Drosera rotundifolia]
MDEKYDLNLHVAESIDDENDQENAAAENEKENAAVENEQVVANSLILRKRRTTKSYGACQVQCHGCEENCQFKELFSHGKTSEKKIEIINIVFGIAKLRKL